MADLRHQQSQVNGTRAHDAIDGDNPIKVGQRAIAHGANPTAVAAADVTNWYANRHGIPFIIGGHPNVVTKTAKVLASDGAQTNTSLVTVSAGTKIVVTRLSVMASNANSVDVRVLVGFATASLGSPGTGGTTQLLGEHPNMPKGGGFTLGDGSGILGIGADDADVRYTSTVATGGSITITVSYYTIES